ncbi:MAG: MFS transporter [Saprospiraceae bacterium]|nr:MFS transporter [Saprospiraceae bacterium]
MRTMQKRLTNTFYAILSLPATAMGFALSVQIAALSWILNTKYGFNLEEIGLVWMAGPAAGILGQVIIGVISDNVWFWNGRRRPFIIIGGTIAALMLLALPNIDVINDSLGIGSLIGVAITVALSLDLAINISFNPTRSVIADVTPPGDARTKGYTWMQSISGFFGVLAYLIGAFISNYTLIYFGAVVVFVCSILPLFFIEEPRELSAGTEEDGELVPSDTDWLEFGKICFAHAFTWLGVQTMFVYTFAYIKEVIMGYETTVKLSAEQNDHIGFVTGIAFAVLNTVGFLLPALVLEPLSKRIGRVKTHMACIAIMAIGYGVVVFFGQSSTMLFLSMIVIGVGWAAVVSLPFAIMSETVNQAKMGMFMGLFNLSVVLPQLVASSLGKFIDGQSDKSIIYIISAIALAVSAVLWLLVKEQKSEGKLSAGGAH